MIEGFEYVDKNVDTICGTMAIFAKMYAEQKHSTVYRGLAEAFSTPSYRNMFDSFHLTRMDCSRKRYIQRMCEMYNMEVTKIGRPDKDVQYLAYLTFRFAFFFKVDAELIARDWYEYNFYKEIEENAEDIRNRDLHEWIIMTNADLMKKRQYKVLE